MDKVDYLLAREHRRSLHCRALLHTDVQRQGKLAAPEGLEGNIIFAEEEGRERASLWDVWASFKPLGTMLACAKWSQLPPHWHTLYVSCKFFNTCRPFLMFT